MFFSLIIPTYNVEDCLFTCVDSIFSQSFSDFEIIVVDGLSTDNTVGIIKNYCTKHNNIHLNSEKDNGIYDAMNKGIKSANGEWLLFLGSDDTFHNEHVLWSVYQSIQTHSEPKMIYGNVKIIGNNNWAKDGQIYDGEFDLNKLLKKNISHQCIFYHKSIFNEVGFFNQGYIICADWDFNLRCFAKIDVQYINLIVANFSAGGLSSSTLKNDTFLNLDFVDNCASYFGTSIYNSLFKNHYHVLLNKAIWFFQNKKYGKGLNHFFAALYLTDNKIYCLKVFIKSIVFQKS